jgi:D-alanyl-D-alanine carboxypeptidase
MTIWRITGASLGLEPTALPRVLDCTGAQRTVISPAPSPADNLDMNRHLLRAISIALAVAVVLGALPSGDADAVRLRARQAGAYDPFSDTWLVEKGIDQKVPVASITKVMAAITFLSMHPDLDQLVTIRRSDWKFSGKTKLRIGDQVPVRTLLRLALASSDNCAARALCHPFGLTYEAFGYQMQQTAHKLGFKNSVFVEPTGRDKGNLSTVRDVARIFAHALQDPVLSEFLGTDSYVLETPRGDRAMVHSSRLLRARRDVVAAKTGYIDAAGYCLVQCTSDAKGAFITVVLGCPTRSSRNHSTARLIDEVRKQRKAGV